MYRYSRLSIHLEKVDLRSHLVQFLLGWAFYSCFDRCNFTVIVGISNSQLWEVLLSSFGVIEHVKIIFIIWINLSLHGYHSVSKFMVCHSSGINLGCIKISELCWSCSRCDWYLRWESLWRRLEQSSSFVKLSLLHNFI